MTGLRQKKKSERKDRIFSAAVELFNKQGFTNTSMQDIADQANLAVGTLYNYFPSKNDLLLDIMQEEMDIAITENDEMFKPENLHEKGAKNIIKQLYKKILDIPLLIHKENLREIFVATFSSEIYSQKGMMLDIDLMNSFELLLRRLQEENLINQKIDTYNATKIFYSILMVQMMMYLFSEDMNKSSLFKNTDAVIDLVYQGVKP